ncbi:DUF4386 family protein [Oryzobacter terrae]|uniref:DUF4386 family protein n=1 Tax=Oryzobacter terrae TaxID=1620385 RepID=UPI00366E4C1A
MTTTATRTTTPTRVTARPVARRDPAAARALTADERSGARLAGVSLVLVTLVSLPAAGLLGSATAAGAETTRLVLGLAFLVVAVLDVVAAWGLHVMLRRRATPASTAQLVSRSGYAVLLAGAAAVLAWPGGAGTTGFERDWEVALVVFGLHLVIAGIALWRSRLVPRAVAAATALAGFAYLADALLTRATETSAAAVLVPLMLGELVLMGWLLLASRTAARSSGNR